METNPYKILPAIALGVLLASNNVLAGTPVDGIGGLGLGAKVGTLGWGVELIKPMSNKLDLRLGANQFDYEADETLDDVDYNVDLRLQTLSALADWRPQGGGFFISGGVMSNSNKLDASATATTADPIDIGNTTITSGTANAGISFDDLSPYLGIGYRKPASKPGLSFTTEAGILYQGAPDITLSESTNTVSPTDINAEIDNIRDDLDPLRYMPVLSVGMAYNF